MQAERTQHSIKSVLQQEARCSEQLVATLTAEREALIARDSNALEAAIQKKLECCQQLEKLDQDRQAILSEMGITGNPDAVVKWLNALPDNQTLTGLWRDILQNLARCRTANLTNGGILESGRQQVEQALRILRGQQGTPALYNPDGATSSNLGRRELGKV